jgi:hypothetical protein
MRQILLTSLLYPIEAYTWYQKDCGMTLHFYFTRHSLGSDTHRKEDQNRRNWRTHITAYKNPGSSDYSKIP